MLLLLLLLRVLMLPAAVLAGAAGWESVTKAGWSGVISGAGLTRIAGTRGRGERVWCDLGAL